MLHILVDVSVVHGHGGLDGEALGDVELLRGVPALACRLTEHKDTQAFVAEAQR